MLASLQARQPGATLRHIMAWYAVQFIGCLCFTSLYRFRAWGMANIPASGPVLFLSNHQSFMDPVIIGVGAHRRQFYAMARSSLFAHPAFAWLIRTLNAIPIARGESDIAAMRRCIDVLKANQGLLVFPEGTRTRDGRTARFATGTMLLIKRAKPVIVPVAIEGAYDVWPRDSKAPRLGGRIGLMFGEPIEADALIAMGAEAGLAHLRDKVEAMRLQIADRFSR